jgi:hypothetical protein
MDLRSRRGLYPTSIIRNAQVTQSGLEFHTDNVAVVGSNPILGTHCATIDLPR